MKEDKYTKSLAKNQVCAIVHMRQRSEKRFTQFYKALYGDAMLVSPILPPETNLFLSFPTNGGILRLVNSQRLK